MIATRITPKTIWLGLGIHLGAWLLLHLPAHAGWTAHFWIGESLVRTAGLSIAYGLAVALNLEIAGEYRNARWLRLAWLSLAGNAMFLLARTLVESQTLDLVWTGYRSHPIAGLLLHLAIVPANGLLLLGLLAMAVAYQRVGLGFRIEPRDYAAMAGILGLMIALLLFRKGLSEAQSPYPAARALQQAGLIMLSLSAAVSLILQRMAAQMEGGRLAVALRMLTLFTLLRAVLVLCQALFRLHSPELNLPLSLPSLYLDLGWQSAPWIAALAAAQRGQLTLHAAETLRRQRALRAAPASA